MQVSRNIIMTTRNKERNEVGMEREVLIGCQLSLFEMALAMVKRPISGSPPPKRVATSSSSSSLSLSMGGVGSLQSDVLAALVCIPIPHVLAWHTTACPCFLVLSLM